MNNIPFEGDFMNNENIGFLIELDLLRTLLYLCSTTRTSTSLHLYRVSQKTQPLEITRILLLSTRFAAPGNSK